MPFQTQPCCCKAGAYIAVSAGADCYLGTVDLTNGSTTLIDKITGVPFNQNFGSNGLRIGSDNNLRFFYSYNDGGGFTVGTRQYLNIALYTAIIDLTTVSLSSPSLGFRLYTDVTPNFGSGTPIGYAIDPAGNTYSAVQRGHLPSTFEIILISNTVNNAPLNEASSTIEFWSSTFAGISSDLELDGAGTLYVLVQRSDGTNDVLRLYTVDPSTGASTFVRDVTTELQYSSAVRLEGANKLAYSSADEKIYSIGLVGTTPVTKLFSSDTPLGSNAFSYIADVDLSPFPVSNTVVVGFVTP